MRTKTLRTALAALTILAAVPLTSFADANRQTSESSVWLRVEVREPGRENPTVMVTLPLSLIEVVLDNVDYSKAIAEIKSDKGVDLAKMWRQMRDMELNEFITVDKEEAKVRVFKEREVFRMTVQEHGYDSPNVEVRLPFAVMDFLFEEGRDKFDFQELVNALRGHLPLTVVEAKHDDQRVKVWLEEK